MIVLDLLSFVRNKKKVFCVVKDYGELVKDSLDILVENGIFIVFINVVNVLIE